MTLLLVDSQESISSVRQRTVLRRPRENQVRALGRLKSLVRPLQYSHRCRCCQTYSALSLPPREFKPIQSACRPSSIGGWQLHVMSSSSNPAQSSSNLFRRLTWQSSIQLFIRLADGEPGAGSGADKYFVSCQFYAYVAAHTRLPDASTTIHLPPFADPRDPRKPGRVSSG